MEEFRDAIGCMHANFSRVDQGDLKLMWTKYAPAEFKKNFPQNLKKYNKVSPWIKKKNRKVVFVVLIRERVDTVK